MGPLNGDDEEEGAATPPNPTYAELAHATDESVSVMLQELGTRYPEHSGAGVAGAVAAITRHQMVRLPHADPTAIMSSIAPMVREMSTQLSAKRKAAPTLPGLRAGEIRPPIQMAFESLNAHVKEAPVPTFVIWSPSVTLVLVSIMLANEGLRSFASLPDLHMAITAPSALIQAHADAAGLAWSETEIPDGR